MGSRYHATSFLGYRNRNFNIAVQLGNWADQDGTGICFDSISHCPTELRDRRMRPGSNWSAGMP